ncbi:hypothetical protein D3H55_23375 [Bacillus salacetis]|uniref:Uncharacterized protein n=1 Tax=Bacillus salacetis TaxID=2315464 RepID=A0A3A1QLB8_9BACI|nr:hypothetical protein D3H55_23375 [Bacillus salacetis]
MPDLPLVFQGFTLERKQFFSFLPGINGDLPGYYLIFSLNSNKVYEKSLKQKLTLSDFSRVSLIKLFVD